MEQSTNVVPLVMVHRLNGPPQACKACRAKKRRCDRTQPCANCSLRQLKCEYAETTRQESSVAATTSHNDARSQSTWPGSHPCASEDLLKRISRLEEAVFKQASVVAPSDPPSSSETEELATRSADSLGPSMDMRGHIHAEPEFSAAEVVDRLPPKLTAQTLFDHFTSTLHLTNCILHIPSARDVLSQTYYSIHNGGSPNVANLLLLYSIFAGAALAWTPKLIGQLNLTKAGIESAFKDYADAALSVAEIAFKSLSPSFVALQGLVNLANVIVNADSYFVKASLLRVYSQNMARSMNLHRLDTAKVTEERKAKGYSIAELEAKRRIWWDMVASDWLSSFVGSDQDAVYTFHPQHMRVNLPANIDDEMMAAGGELQSLPLSTPTFMSGFIIRIKMAELCREIVDRMPSILLEGNGPDYDLVLEIDQKLQNYIQELPVYFRLDPRSMEESEAICRSRPYIPLHRVNVNFAINTRICRLHRMYYLEGLTNPQYAYSRTMCLQSAHRILELRRSMDTAAVNTGLHPARSWRITQHVYVAALTLATDVSINPDAPGVEDRKAKVMAAYGTLESSIEEAHTLMGRIQKNIQALLSTLESRKPSTSALRSGSAKRKRVNENVNITSGVTLIDHPPSTSLGYMGNTNDSRFQIPEQEDIMMETVRQLDGVSSVDWGANIFEEGQMWSDFLAAASEIDGEDWNFFLDST